MPVGDPGGNFAASGGYGSFNQGGGGFQPGGALNGGSAQYGIGQYGNGAGASGGAGNNYGSAYNTGWNTQGPLSGLPINYTMPLGTPPDPRTAGWHYSNPGSWNVTDNPMIGSFPDRTRTPGGWGFGFGNGVPTAGGSNSGQGGMGAGGNNYGSAYKTGWMGAGGPYQGLLSGGKY